MDLNLIERYRALGIDEIIDHEKFNHIAIVHHSTKIEGSTLTEIETQILLDEGLTPKGKPVSDTFMVRDHHQALQFVVQEAHQKTPVTADFINKINALVLKNTGQIYNTPLGTIDATKGEFRKGNVSAGSSYFPNFDKVIPMVNKLVDNISEEMKKPGDIIKQINLSFDSHFYLVSIHPWYDGNGRTSRLFMNYIQTWYKLPLAIVFSEDKAEYIKALRDTRQNDDINIFRKFMGDQYEKHLKTEIKKFEQIQSSNRKPGMKLLL